jgi:hypothetical protein
MQGLSTGREGPAGIKIKKIGHLKFAHHAVVR